MRRSHVVTGVVAAALCGTAAFLLFRSPGRHTPVPPPPVSTVALNTKACLFTDGGADAATAFAGMQSAARSGGLNVQQLTIPPKALDPGSYLNSLIQQKCAIIAAVGPVAVSAVNEDAGYQTATRFIVAGPGPSSGNVVRTGATPLTADAVSSAVLDAQHAVSASTATGTQPETTAS